MTSAVSMPEGGSGGLAMPSPETLRKIEEFQAWGLSLPREQQVNPPIEHSLHGGMYARTVRIPAGTIGVGATVRVTTQVILNGHCLFNNGDQLIEFEGFHVLKGIPGRKQMVFALSDTQITAIHRTDAKTIEEAENEAAGEEAELLSTRRFEGELLGNGHRRGVGCRRDGGEQPGAGEAAEEGEPDS